MFGKKQPDMEVIIGPDSGIKGEINSKGTVRIDGTFEGNINAECVIIGETGAMNGDVSAKGCILGGRIIGNIHASESVEIRPKGEIRGDIYATRLIMAEGARFDGRSYMQRPQGQGELEYVPQEEPLKI